MPTTKHLPKSLWIIFITLFIDVLGLGIVVPVLPGLIQTFFDGSHQDAAYFYGFLTTIYALTQFLFSSVLGALSDRYGRRPVLLLSLLGLGVDYFIMAFAPSLTWFVLARVLSGVMGASYSTAMAYIADVSTPQTRTQNFGLVGVAFGLGFIAGPAIGGALGHIDLHWPFVAAGVISLINACAAWRYLPESLPVEKRRPVVLKQLNPFGAFFKLKEFVGVGGLITAYGFASVAHRMLETFWVVFTAYRFKWDILQVSLSLVVIGLLTAVVQGGLIRVLKKNFSDQTLIYGGFTIQIIGFVLLAFVSEPWMVFAILPLIALGSVSEPAVHSRLSVQVGERFQGGLQGVMASLTSLTGVVAPMVAMSVFVKFSGHNARIEFPGAPFLVAALFYMVGLFLVQQSIRKSTPQIPRQS